MGSGIEFLCKGCGFRKEVWYGPGFLSDPRSPETREKTLNGKYGRKPKKVLEDHPDAECAWYRPLFRCTCGNYSTKDAVVIHEEGETLYRPSMRCDLCGRRMREVSGPSDYLPCPKCGSLMRWD